MAKGIFGYDTRRNYGIGQPQGVWRGIPRGAMGIPFDPEREYDRQQEEKRKERDQAAEAAASLPLTDGVVQIEDVGLPVAEVPTEARTPMVAELGKDAVIGFDAEESPQLVDVS